MPRLIESDKCPHCAGALERDPEAPNSVCPHCGGSLQQRYLKAGCFTSAPHLILGAVVALRWLAEL
jgi:hypothetical protein